MTSPSHRPELAKYLIRLETVKADPPVTRHVSLIDAADLASIAGRLGLVALASLEADLEVRKVGSHLFRISGQGRAVVTYECGVTLDPFDAEHDLLIDLTVTDREEDPATAGEEVELSSDDLDAPDVMPDGIADLLDLLVEELSLALDPYPRNPEAPEVTSEKPDEDEEKPHPFAALSALRDRMEGRGD